MAVATGERQRPSDSDRRTIHISAGLYADLREYCDRVGIPFVRFAEEALEKATYVDEIETLLNDGGKMLAKIEVERHRGMAHGFALGVLAAFLVREGVSESGRLLTPEAAGQFMPSTPTTGEQIKLFD